jgi:Tfp pilus assembly protein PilX
MKPAFPSITRNRGTVLALCLVLLLVITVVATAGMTTSTLQLRMVAGTQAGTGTFQVAGNAVETALACFRADQPDTFTADTCPAVSTAADEAVSFRIERMPTAAIPLPEGMSLGSDLDAKGFVIDASAEGRRGVATEVTQGFYVIGPRE